MALSRITLGALALAIAAPAAAQGWHESPIERQGMRLEKRQAHYGQIIGRAEHDPFRYRDPAHLFRAHGRGERNMLRALHE